MADLQKRIEALDPEIAATPCAEFVNSISQIQITRTMSWFTSIFAIVIGALGVMNTMAMTVFERRGEIVTLRAMGWRKWRIARMIMGEAVFLAALGTVIGIAIGLGITFFLAHWHRTSVLVQGNISLRAIAEGTIVAAAIAICGGAFPAWRCANLPIAETLRSS
jgi:putative ABC transport system permease protein